MSKKRRQPAQGQDKTAAGRISRPVSASDGGGDAAPRFFSDFKSRALWLTAFILIISGFAALKKADPWGQNAWSTAAPALLLAGYLLILPALILSFRRRA